MPKLTINVLVLEVKERGESERRKTQVISEDK